MSLAVIKAKGGMGNRMLCAVSGILWARLAGRRCFVDWRDDAYSRSGENSFPHFFAADGLVDTPPPDDERDVAPDAWAGRLGLSVSNAFHAHDPRAHRDITAHRRWSIDPRRTDQPRRVAVFWHYIDQLDLLRPRLHRIDEAFRGLGYRDTVGHAVRTLLPLRPEIAAWIDDFAAEHLDTPAVGVHVRFTDRRVPIDRCEAAARVLLDRLDARRIFLATDSREVEDRFRDRFGDVVVTEKWLPEPGQTLHQNQACADPVANGIEALRDMFLLARCRGLVYASRSTFSLISACAGRFGRGAVIDVDARNPAVLAKRLVRRVVA